MSKAKVTISGFIGRKEMKVIPSGMSVLEFSIPTEKKWTDKTTQEKKSKTSWHNLKAFGRTAESIDTYVNVGDGLIVFGDLETEEWTDKDTQAKRSKTVINVNEFDFPPVKRDQNNSNQQAPQQNQQSNQQTHQAQQNSNPAPPQDFDNFNDDIPFAPLNVKVY